MNWPKVLLNLLSSLSPSPLITYNPQRDNPNMQQQQQHQQQPYESYSSYSGAYESDVGFHASTDWTTITLQAYPYTTQITQGMSYIIRNLLPDQQYEAKVIAR